VAVQLVVLDGVDSVGVVLRVVRIVGHAISHALGDVFDDLPVCGLDLLELLNHNIELYEELSVLLVGAVVVEVPSVLLQKVVEVPQNWLLLRQWYCHVILHCVEAAQNQVEERNGNEKLGVQFQNDGRETSASLGKEVEASLEVFCLLGFIALVDGVVPDFPVRSVSEDSTCCTGKV
jgi:hypothetical protein